MMRTRTVIPWVAGTLIAFAAHAAPPEPSPAKEQRRIPQFTAEVVDFAGGKEKAGSFDSRATDGTTVYIVVGTTCPATNAYAERFRGLDQEYRPKGVDFVYVYPNREDTTEQKLAFHRDKRLGGCLIDDQGGKVARLLGARRTSEVFIADADANVTFNGGLDDSREAASVKKRYVAAALDEMLAGQPVTVPFSQVFA